MDAPRPHPPPHPEPDAITGLLVVASPIAGTDVPRLCERLTAVIATCDAQTIVCDVGALPANIQTIDALVRLQLSARRHQRRIRLRRPTPELEALLEFVGLADVLPALRSQRHRHPEQREHPRRVEERVDRGDPPV
jgi:hypothetical protein